MPLPLVAIVGRPNVGKSSLFNRIVRDRLAVVDDRPGVTRDRHLAVAEWTQHSFFLVDTGGYLPGSKEALDSAVRRQAEIAIEGAHVILFIVDAHSGPTDLDEHLARVLRRQEKPCLLVVNKADRFEDLRIHEFHGLGLGDPWGVSATQGSGVGDMLDELVGRLPELPEEEDARGIRVAIVGRPNVGKSSLVNALLGQERMVVHSEPGTTVDSVDSRFRADDQNFVLVDTAGIRHRGEYEDDAEFYATLRSLRAIDRAEVVTVLVEAHVGFVRQDFRVIRAALEAGRPVLIAYNKWDLVEDREARWLELGRIVKQKHPWLIDIPKIAISTVSRAHLHQLPSRWVELREESVRTIPTPALNEWLRDIQTVRQAPSNRLGRPAQIYYASQSGTRPPRFTLFASQPEAIHDAYQKFLLKSLREHFAYTGTPVRLEVKKSQ